MLARAAESIHTCARCVLESLPFLEHFVDCDLLRCQILCHGNTEHVYAISYPIMHQRAAAARGHFRVQIETTATNTGFPSDRSAFWGMLPCVPIAGLSHGDRRTAQLQTLSLPKTKGAISILPESLCFIVFIKKTQKLLNVWSPLPIKMMSLQSWTAKRPFVNLKMMLAFI